MRASNVASIDAIAGLLDGPRAREAFLLRASMDPPWSIRVRDEAPLTVIALVRGAAAIVPASGRQQALGPGDVAIVRGPEPYTVADGPATEPTAVIHPGQRCTTLAGEELAERWRLGVRSWGNSADGATVMLVGAYGARGEVGGRLLDALPPVVVLARDAWDSPVVPLLAEEIVKDDPGQEAVLDRLLDLLLIGALRAWLARPEAQAPDWYRAQSDPAIGHALRLMHHNPAHPWTLAELARECGLSRAAFARRFAALVGEPPMAFLTGWRLALAADLLRAPGATLASVAAQVGYGSPFALSVAFKRVRGVSPREHRRAA